MYKIDFLKDFLNKKISKKVKINTLGILEFKIDIVNFNYEIQRNELIIKDDKKICLKVIFDEVRNVKSMNNKICIDFNIKECINIE